MHLIQLLLPVSVGRRRRTAALHDRVKDELTRRFGGMTRYSRSPAEGLWKSGRGARAQADDIVVYEVMAPSLDRRWWRTYRRALEKRFDQDEVVIRAQKIERV